VEEIKRRIDKLIEINARILKELEELNKALTRNDKRTSAR
jgi:hypothetical protein